jgi:hypothetical protein
MLSKCGKESVGEGNLHLVLLEIKSKLTNIPPKKKRRGGVTRLLRETWGLFRKESELCECEECGASLTLTSSVYICQVPNPINFQLQTLHYQQLVDKELVLSTVG